jgi:hypothetical protein
MQSVEHKPKSKKKPQQLPLKKTTTRTKRPIVFSPSPHSLVRLIIQCMLLIGMAHAQENNSVVVSNGTQYFNLTLPNSNGTTSTESYILSVPPPINTRLYANNNHPPPPPRHPSPPPPPPSPSPPTGSLPFNNTQPLNDIQELFNGLRLEDLENIRDDLTKFTIYLNNLNNLNNTNETDYLTELFKFNSNDTIIPSTDINIIRKIFETSFFNSTRTLEQGFSLPVEKFELEQFINMLDKYINSIKSQEQNEKEFEQNQSDVKKDSIIIGSVIAFLIRVAYIFYQKDFAELLETDNSNIAFMIGTIKIIIIPAFILRRMSSLVRQQIETPEVGSAVGGKKQDYTKTTEKYGSRCVYLSKRKGKYLKVDGKFMPYKSAVKMLDKKKKTSKSNK